MTYPAFLRKLFDNEGAGPMLKEDITPAVLYGKEQTLTDEQKTQACSNAGAVKLGDLINALDELIVEYGGTSLK